MVLTLSNFLIKINKTFIEKSELQVLFENFYQNFVI